MKLMNRKEAAEFLGITPNYLGILVNNSKSGIPFVTLSLNSKGRKYYTREALENWLKARTKTQQER
ncbi:helix-turn-helix domain protein [Peptococcaceae bacterium CEB3]|nr:helix-turn-helix domain protein [Peptococcaceae bacterium CEB3]